MQGRPLARLGNCAHELVLCILPLLCFLFCWVVLKASTVAYAVTG
jgi:hypothetical protein